MSTVAADTAEGAKILHSPEQWNPARINGYETPLRTTSCGTFMAAAAMPIFDGNKLSKRCMRTLI